MYGLLFLSLVAQALLVKDAKSSALTRDENLDTGLPTIKRPRDVETVAKMKYLDPGKIEGMSLDVPNLVDPDGSDENLLDVRVGYNLHSGQSDETYWSLWSEWADCSRSCGGGVSSRARKCISRRSATIVDFQCEGSSAEHRLCNKQECPEGAQDFREMQCSQRNDEVVLSRTFKWIPFTGKDGSSCELSCQAQQFHFYHSFGPALDGTRCGAGKKGICIKGDCVQIGCDGIIGSTMTVDACGACGGNNGTCIRYQNVVDRLPAGGTGSGYSKIAEIPAGSTNIEVKDHNINYLALVEVDGGKETYIINGGWIVNFPGQFKTAGTLAIYDRIANKETFEISGPTTKTLRIMVLSLGQEPLVEYEYWLPAKKMSTSGMSAFRAQQSTIIRVPDEDDFRNQIVAAGLDFNAVVPPTPTPSTTAPTTPRPTTERTDPKTPPPPSSPATSCKSCRKVTNRKKQFCDSDLVIHVRVLPKRPFHKGGFVRYEVEILNNYKSNVRMSRREYVWISSTCCPRLRPYRHYLLMGRTIKVYATSANQSNAIELNPRTPQQYETKLLVDNADFWYTWRKYQIKLARATKHIKCKRYRYQATRYYRRKLNEG